MKLRDAVNEQKRESLKVIQSDLKDAYLRLLLRSPMAIPGLLKNYSPEELAEYITPPLIPPTSPEEVKIQLLADLVVSLLFPEKKIAPIIWEALPEIEEAYNAVAKDGGGWSTFKDEIDTNKRKSAAISWYRGNQARISHLKEAHLEDTTLYADGGGQEKRNFVGRLIIKIVKDMTNEVITFDNVKDHLTYLKKLKTPLRLEDL